MTDSRPTFSAHQPSDADIVEFVRRLTFSALLGNADMHLKNWPLIYPDRRRAAVAPAYDLLSTIPYIPDENCRTLPPRRCCRNAWCSDTAHETVALFHQHWQSENAIAEW